MTPCHGAGDIVDKNCVPDSAIIGRHLWPAWTMKLAVKQANTAVFSSTFAISAAPTWNILPLLRTASCFVHTFAKPLYAGQREY